jgi:hypothetical protein
MTILCTGNPFLSNEEISPWRSTAPRSSRIESVMPSASWPSAASSISPQLVGFFYSLTNPLRWCIMGVDPKGRRDGLAVQVSPSCLSVKDRDT